MPRSRCPRRLRRRRPGRRGRGGGGQRWGVIEAPDPLDIVFGVPPLPVAILPWVDQAALFESFQGSRADAHLVSRFSNAHTSSPDASLSRPFWIIRGHSRPRAARGPGLGRWDTPGAVRLPGLPQTLRAASLTQPVYRLQRGSCIALCGNALLTHPGSFMFGDWQP